MNIKQIVFFNLKPLRIAGFLEYLQQTDKLVKAYRDSGEEGQSALPAKVEAVYVPFVRSLSTVDQAYKLSRASEYTQKIAEEDNRRDGLYLLLTKQLKMYMKFTFDAEKKSAAEYLWNIMKKYGIDVDENYSEESGKLQQMLQELEENAQAGQRITALGLESLVTQLNTANEQVRTLMGYRNDERMYQEKEALANARENADEAYRTLVQALNAAAVMDDAPNRFDELFSQVNELIKYYRQYVVPKAGKKDEEEEPDNGSSTVDGDLQSPSDDNPGSAVDGDLQSPSNESGI